MGAAGEEPSVSSYAITQRPNRHSFQERPAQFASSYDGGQQPLGSSWRSFRSPDPRRGCSTYGQQSAQPHTRVRPKYTQPCIRPESPSFFRRPPHCIASSAQLPLARLPKTHTDWHRGRWMRHDHSLFGTLPGVQGVDCMQPSMHGLSEKHSMSGEFYSIPLARVYVMTSRLAQSIFSRIGLA